MSAQSAEEAFEAVKLETEFLRFGIAGQVAVVARTRKERSVAAPRGSTALRRKTEVKGARTAEANESHLPSRTCGLLPCRGMLRLYVEI